MKKNNYTKMIFSGLFILSLSFATVYGDVFTFGPGGKGKPWASELFGGAKLWKEPAVVNGVKSEIGLLLLKQHIDECYQILKNKFPDARFRFNRESMLVKIKREKGVLERVYFVNVGGNYPVLQFSIEIPADLTKDPVWPKELPKPNEASPVTVIELTKRDVVYGAFTSSSTAEQVIREMDSSMLSNGWKSMGKGVYMKDNPQVMILLSATDDKKGKTHGFVLKRELSGN